MHRRSARLGLCPCTSNSSERSSTAYKALHGSPQDLQRCDQRRESTPCQEDRLTGSWHSPLLLGAVSLVLLTAFRAEAAVSVLPAAEAAVSQLPVIGDKAFREGAVSGFLLILFSELGDKTFFIALLLSLNKSKAAVFTGTFGALAIMSVISVALGQVLHQADELLPFKSPVPLDDVLAALLLIFFGVKTLQDAKDAGDGGERSEAEEEVERLGTGTAGLVLSTLALVFAAEWGDKSFLATIALAAASSPLGVTAGAIAGHGVATGIAVLGGSVLGEVVSEQVVQYVGGSLFLAFAGVTVFDIIAKTSAGLPS
ncbi:hypothetical protein WJX73_008234 [Symbiochloris irregularis]|uniref:GDT1 family protein n=1 Tax=Symbiochloris irregularis TaxID=706552 RepID=A0AAW1Q2P6_9CHLO